MVRARARPAPPLPPARPAPFAGALDLVLAAAAGAIAALVFHRATHYYFSADDFDGLARARGLLAPRADLARFLPWHLFFPVFSRAFGLDPVPYHVASLAVHAAASVLVFAWARPLTGRWSAFVGAAFYAAHPAHFGSAYWISAISDPLAITFGLAALLLLRVAGPVRVLALPAFALALLSKECALLFPVVALFDPRPPGDTAAARRSPPAPLRDPVLAGLAALAALLVAYYRIADPFATRHAGAEAYVLTPGPHVFENLLTYAGWTAAFFPGAMRSMSDAVEPRVFAWGALVLAIGIAGAFDAGLRRRGWLAGAALWLASLALVLLLAHHTYRYYLGAPLAGAALCLAALASRASEIAGARAKPAVLPHAWPARGLAPHPRWIPAIALGLAGLLAWNGAALVGTLEFAPFSIPGLRADAFTDRGLIAGRAIAALAAAGLPPGVTLRFWSPRARAAAGIPDSVDAECYAEKNVRTALLDGLGVRVALPAVRRVEFVPRFTGAADTVWYAVYREDGALRAGSSASLESAIATRVP